MNPIEAAKAALELAPYVTAGGLIIDTLLQLSVDEEIKFQNEVERTEGVVFIHKKDLEKAQESRLKGTKGHK